MDFEFNMKGAKELDAMLKKLPEELARKAAEQATRAGANTLRKAIREKAPEADGKLKQNVIVKKDKFGPSSVNFQVGTSKAVPYAHLVEFGTTAHKIKAGSKRGNPTGKKALANPKTGALFGKAIEHPGSKAQPFFRPAIDEAAPDALHRMREVMARAIAKVSAKFVGR